MVLSREGDVQGDVFAGDGGPGERAETTRGPDPSVWPAAKRPLAGTRQENAVWGSEGDVQGDVRCARFPSMRCLAPQAVERAHNGIPDDAADDKSGTNQARTPVLAGSVRRVAGGMALAVAGVALAGCSSGPTHSGVTKPTPAPTSSLPAGSSATQAAVLSAWVEAEQTLYAYSQQPWEQQRADLVAGETSANLWPKLTDYYVNPALQSEDQFLVGVKMDELTGPTSYDLGHPTVTALSATAATVSGCIYDTGTTTAAGKAGPATLGGGAGYASGTWQLQLVGGSWKIATFKTTTVTKC